MVELASVADVQDLAVFQTYIRNEVQRSVTRQLHDLRERLRSLGLESVRALVNVKSVALPPLAAAAAQAAGLNPTVLGPAVLAACLVGVPANLREKRRAAIRDSPVGYLFTVSRHLDSPAGLAKRIRNCLLLGTSPPP